jgi:DNA modification methylase
VRDPDFTLLVGDVRDALSELPDESVHCVVTSPPYWGLRDYGTGQWEGGDPDCDHAEKPSRNDGGRRISDGVEFSRATHKWAQFMSVCGKCGARRVDRQLGLEPTPDEYVENVVAVFREVRRVMRRDATLWLNLGDAFADKQLQGLPWRVAFALQADGWYLRADIIWSKPNPMPESVTDRPTKAHEFLFLLTRSPRYFYDADAIRERYETWEHHAKYHSAPQRDDQTNKNAEHGRGGGHGGLRGSGQASGNELTTARGPDGRRKTTVLGQDGSAQHRDGERWPNPSGRNKRSVWEIATEPYPDAHFATFPTALVEPCVLAGTSERGCCPECGAPWVREISQQENLHPGDSGSNDVQGLAQRGKRPDGKAIGTVMRERHEAGRARTTLGWWPSCPHTEPKEWGAGPPTPVPCTVLDPFLGSGTTALVARKHGRRSIGIELNPEYAQLAAKRLSQLSLLAEGAP